MICSQQTSRRSSWVVPTVSLLMIVALLTALPGQLVRAQDAGATDAIKLFPGVLDDDPAELDCAEAAAPTQVFTIVSEESEARYLAEEELAGRGQTTAIGATNAFIGQILFDEAGLPLPCSQFFVDLRTLTSDEARRDNYLYRNTLQTETYPLATFILTSVEGLDEPLVEGEETTLFLIGDLNLHDVTRVVVWEATVTLDGKTLSGTATTEFDMPDFDIVPPRVGPVLSLEETVTLEIDITATLGA